MTALNAILENMILGIGKYKDRDRCLLECKEITGQLSFMIKEILDTSRLDFTQEKQDAETFDLSERLPAICEPYQLIAKAKGIGFSFSIQGKCPVHTSKKGLEKSCPICFQRGFLHKAGMQDHRSIERPADKNRKRVYAHPAG